MAETIYRNAMTAGVKVTYVTGDPSDTSVEVVLSDGGTPAYLTLEEFYAVGEEMLRIYDKIVESNS